MDEGPQIEAAVQRVHDGRRHETAVGEREIIDVAMHDVEIVRARERLRELERVQGEGIGLRGIEPQRARPRRDEPGVRARVTAGEERDLVATLHELVGEPRHDTFGASVESRWNRLVQRRNLSDTHAVAPEMQLQCR